MRNGYDAFIGKSTEMVNVIGFVRAPVDGPEGRQTQRSAHPARMRRTVKVDRIVSPCMGNKVSYLSRFELCRETGRQRTASVILMPDQRPVRA